MKGLKKTASEKEEQRKRKSDGVDKETNDDNAVKKMRM